MKHNETFIAFLKLVEEMRQVQRLYFSNRSYSSLKKAKQLEARVDNTISQLKHDFANPTTEQLHLDFPY